MYLGSLRLAFTLYPYIVLAVAVEILLELLMQQDVLDTDGSLGVIIFWSFVACHAHFSILLPADRDRRADNKIMAGFCLRYFGLTALFLVLTAVFILLGFGDLNTWPNGAGNQASSMNKWGVTLTVILSFLLVFSLLGTVLPAYVAGREQGVKKALQRGVRYILPLMVRLIVGPGIIYFGPFFLIEFLFILQQVPDTFFIENWVPNFPALIALPLLYCFKGWAIVMTAWILSHAFLMSEAEDKKGHPLPEPG